MFLLFLNIIFFPLWIKIIIIASFPIKEFILNMFIINSLLLLNIFLLYLNIKQIIALIRNPIQFNSLIFLTILTTPLTIPINNSYLLPLILQTITSKLSQLSIRCHLHIILWIECHCLFIDQLVQSQCVLTQNVNILLNQKL